MKKSIIDKEELLTAIREVERMFIKDIPVQEVFDQMLQVLLQVTNSEYGFIGEVLHDGQQEYLKTHAITNIAWNEQTKTFFEENAPNGLEFKNLKTLFGRVITDKTFLISESPYTDERRGGLPEGHPHMGSFLGMPIWDDDNMCGMFGIANRPGGYEPRIVEELEPIVEACSNLIGGYHIVKERNESTELLRQTNQELQEKNERLEELINLDKAKDRFFSIIAHDLKNPIQSHMGLSELLLMSHKDLDIEERDKIINMMNTSILEIQKLLDNLLQWAMSQADRVKLFKENHQLHSLLNESISIYTQQSAEKNISILNNVPEDVRVYIDKETISVAFRNIISNAIKYSYEGSKILLTSEEDRSQGLYHVSITDYGTGMSQKSIDELFDLSTNNSLLGTNKEKGTGLGLILSKEFAEQNGGQLTVKSIEGSGTTFTVSIPINDN